LGVLGLQRNITRPATYRFWRIHQSIKSGRYPNVPTLAKELEVSRRTVERDIAYIRDLFGAPIEYDPMRRGYKYTEPSFQLPPMELSEGEIAALLVASRLLSAYVDTPIAPVARRVLKRLIELLSDRLLIHPNDVENIICFAHPQSPRNAPLVARRFDAIMDAINRRHQVQMRYFSASSLRERERVIDPYTLYHAGGSWYVIAYCHYREAVRLFALHRIQQLEITDRTFVIPTSYDPTDYMENAWQVYRGEDAMDVVLEFSRCVVPRILERQWHPTQSLETKDDGSVVMCLTVTGEPEIRSWILGWGANCRVIAPESLRRSIHKEVQQLAAYYSPPSSKPFG